MLKKYTILFILIVYNITLSSQINSDTIKFDYTSALSIKNGTLSVQLVKSDTIIKIYYKLIDNPIFYKATEEAKARAKAEYEKYKTDFYRKKLDSINCFRGNKANYNYKVDSFSVPLSAYDDIKQQLKLVIKPYTKEQLRPEGGTDGSYWNLKFWNEGKYYIYRTWSPTNRLQKRGLKEYVDTCYKIVNLTKLNSKNILE